MLLAAPARPDAEDVGLAAHWFHSSLASRLDVEWRQLCTASSTEPQLARWSTVHPILAGYADLPQLLLGITRDPSACDGLLLALLDLAQRGERLAARVVLQAMLGKAVRIAGSIGRRPDVLGDRDEAQATAVAALWQAIAGYRLAARPGRVTANLALDTLALVQRGHTGSSHFTRTFPEEPCADLTDLAHASHHDGSTDDLSGPADAELLLLLAWSVRNRVLSLAEARLLARVYAADGTEMDAKQIAQELQMTWPALRQRCHRLARRLGQAAVAAGITPTDQHRSGALLPAA